MRLRRLHRATLSVGIAVAAVLTLGACGGGASGNSTNSGVGADGKIAVVASTNVYGSIAEAVGGDLVSVHSIINKVGADPHGYEATAQDKLAMSKAVVGIENGGGYDDFFGQLAKGVLDPAKVLNVSDLSGLDTGPDFNEHLWYSLPTMTKLSEELAVRFAAAAPESKPAFEANAQAFNSKIAGLQTRLATLKAARGGAGVAVTEPVPLYLLDEAGLVNQTPAAFSEAVENGSDVPAQVLRETVALMGSGNIKMLAYNSQTESAQTQQVRDAALAAGVPVVDFAETLPAAMTYVSWMDANISNIEKALGK